MDKQRVVAQLRFSADCMDEVYHEEAITLRTLAERIERGREEETGKYHHLIIDWSGRVG